MSEKTNKKITLWGNKALWVLIFTLLGFILSWVRMIVLEEGGEVTYLSMAVVFLAGYVIGWKEGFLCAFLVGTLRFVSEYCVINPISTTDSLFVPEICDIVLGYTLLAFGGLLVHFIKKYHWKCEKYALQIGFLFGVILKLIEGVWNCFYFYDRPGETLAQRWIYAFVYSGSYIGFEAILSIIFLCIPPVIQAIDFLRMVAHMKYTEQYDLF